MALAETWVVCGTTFDDSEVEARIVALRRTEGHQSEAGCGKNIRADFAYRCVECGRWFHRECILTHFSSHGDHYANTISDLTTERNSLALQLDSCQGALKETIVENSANCDRADKAEQEREGFKKRYIRECQRYEVAHDRAETAEAELAKAQEEKTRLQTTLGTSRERLRDGLHRLRGSTPAEDDIA